MSCWLDILHNRPMGLHKIGLNSSFPSSRIIKHLVPGNHIWERPDKWHWNPIGCCRLGVEEECCLFDRFECGWRQSTHASHIPAPFLEPIISPPPLLIAQIAYSTQACVCVCRLKMGRIEKCYNEQNKSENIPVSSLHSFLPTIIQSTNLSVLDYVDINYLHAARPPTLHSTDVLYHSALRFISGAASELITGTCTGM